MRKTTAKIYNWATQKANSPHAPWWLGLLFGLELVLLIPLDAIMVFFCLHHKRSIPFYILIGAAASTFSALIGYTIGHFLWGILEPYLVPNLISPHFFEEFSCHCQNYESLAIFFGAMLPLPLKAISLISGVVYSFGVTSFLIAFFLGRIVRFSLIGGAMIFWGAKVKVFLDRYYHHLFLAFLAKTVLILLLFWVLAS